MTRAVIMAAVLGAFLGGCTKVPDLDPGNCGNRVVEEDEDCDGFADPGLTCGPPETDNECAFTCEAGNAMRPCPPEWQCGRDGRCRQPTGTFDADGVTTLEFPAQELAVGDIDGNGYIDIVGNQSSRVTMRLSEAGNMLADERDLLVPEPIGPLLFDYLDDDGLLDVVVPIAGGLFTLIGNSRRSLEPVPYASLQLNPVGGIMTLAVEAFTGQNNEDRDLEILALTNDGMVFFEADATAAASYPDQGTFATMGRDVAVGNIDTDPLSEVALVFDKKDVVHICEGQTTLNGPEGSLQVVCDPPLTLANPVNAAGGTRFADVDGDGDLDLLVSVTNDGIQKVEVALGDGAGGFALGVVAELFTKTRDQSGNDVSRPNTWPIAVANLDGDEAADYVFSKDILLVATGTTADTVPGGGEVAARAATDTWTSAAVTDINGDGRADVAVSLAQLDGIDFFVNNDDTGLGIVFNKFRKDTDGPPRLLRGGNFDGDTVGDVAFAQGELEDDEPNQIAVCFGNTSGAPSDPISMGGFGKIEVLEPILTSLGIGDLDTITDLAVVFSTESPLSRVANVMRGDSSRRMLSPFFLFTRDEEFDVPQALALGSFGSFGAGSASARDLVVIGKNEDDFRAWLLAGTGFQGGLSAFIEQAPLAPETALDYACALWRAGDLDGMAGDEVVAIDGRSGCTSTGSQGESATLLQMKVAPGAFDGSGSAELVPDVTDLGSEFVNLRALHLHDMDLDDDLDIVAAFQGDERGASSKAVIFWNDGGSFDLQTGRAVIESPPFVFYDAVPIRFGSAAPELLLLSEGFINEELQRLILHASLQPGTRTYGEPITLVPLGSTGHLAVADLDGDGLEDLVYTDDDNAHVVLQIPAQPLGSRPAVATQGAAP